MLARAFLAAILSAGTATASLSAPLPEAARGVAIDPNKGYAVEEIADGLYWVTEGVYTTMFLTTGEGVIVVDAPPSIGDKMLKAIAEKEQPQLIIVGKQAIDDDSNQTGQMTAALLGWSQATFASIIEINGDRAKVTREVDGGLETVKLNTPAVVTTDLRLNEPRYASLPNIMKAKSKPLAQKTPADYGVDTAPRLTTLGVAEPAKRQAGVKVASVDELIGKLKGLGVVA